MDRRNAWPGEVPAGQDLAKCRETSRLLLLLRFRGLQIEIDTLGAVNSTNWAINFLMVLSSFSMSVVLKDNIPHSI